MWLGSSVLAGLILACSLPVMATTQNQTKQALYPMKPPFVVSTSVSSLPSGEFTEVVHKRFKWVSSPAILSTRTNTLPKQSVPSQNNLTVASTQSNQSQPNQPKVLPSSVNRASEVVQVAAATKQQVSRSNSSNLTNHALSLVGVPYVFGGTSRSGFDCSGYTQYVFKGSGTYLPRTASEQFHVGSSVTRNQLQPGDLVFFSTYAPGASHVGIYIGGGRFVHASNSGVRVTNLNDSYYSSRYLGARRTN
jgi:Cell wall-associated hydrolases (invasion-associated proteins)